MAQSFWLIASVSVHNILLILVFNIDRWHCTVSSNISVQSSIVIDKFKTLQKQNLSKTRALERGSFRGPRPAGRPLPSWTRPLRKSDSERGAILFMCSHVGLWTGVLCIQTPNWISFWKSREGLLRVLHTPWENQIVKNKCSPPVAGFAVICIEETPGGLDLKAKHKFSLAPVTPEVQAQINSKTLETFKLFKDWV